MGKIVGSKFFKPFVYLIAFTVINFGFFSSTSKVSASDLNQLVKESDENTGAIILESLKFNKDKTAFIDFNKDYAKSQGLSEEEFVNVDVFFELTGEEFLIFKNAKLELEDGMVHANNKVTDIFKLAVVIAGLAFIGKALITKMTQDLYTLGAKKFCKTWKKYKPIENACKDLGYL